MLVVTSKCEVQVVENSESRGMEIRLFLWISMAKWQSGRSSLIAIERERERERERKRERAIYLLSVVLKVISDWSLLAQWMGQPQ
jgi:hypothetical protein